MTTWLKVEHRRNGRRKRKLFLKRFDRRRKEMDVVFRDFGGSEPYAENTKRMRHVTGG